jgi:hypothetical protein
MVSFVNFRDENGAGLFRARHPRKLAKRNAAAAPMERARFRNLRWAVVLLAGASAIADVIAGWVAVWDAAAGGIPLKYRRRSAEKA